MPDPIEKAASIHEAYQKIAWDVAHILTGMEDLKEKVEKLADEKVNALQMKVGLLEKDVTTLNAKLDTKTADNRWMIGVAVAIVSMLITVGSKLTGH